MQIASHGKLNSCPVGYYNALLSHRSNRRREIDKLALLASHGDSVAERALRDKYLELIVQTSRQYYHPVHNATLLDLIEAGFSGLNQAIKQLKVQKALSFDSRAVEAIRAEIFHKMLNYTKSGCA
ncbi:hypothetical protein JCM19240_962 [Vibrio maritimus]|uniref:Uncharacterized protein n=1 Tax=Vibrio maritimus TaxID=990268 RepID=A0A090T5P3_9VIBR|nr:hypothetical protein JCM19240_962 [Vibrio maritimus]